MVSEIELKDSDFSFSGDASDIIETTSVLCKLFPNGLVQIKSICGYAERLLGRFCCIDDSINKLVKEICDKEQLQNGDDWILAEIVHLPESRIGNISFRPLLRDCELHYLARSGEINEKSFPVSDLMLRFENGHLTIFLIQWGSAFCQCYQMPIIIRCIQLQYIDFYVIFKVIKRRVRVYSL